MATFTGGMLNRVAQRIALFLPSLRCGGAERVMLTLAGAFAESGLNVDLVVAAAEGPYLSHVPPQVRLVDLAASRVLTSLPGLVTISAAISSRRFAFGNGARQSGGAMGARARPGADAGGC